MKVRAATAALLICILFKIAVTSASEDHRRQLIVNGDVATQKQINKIVQLFDVSSMLGDIVESIFPDGATMKDVEALARRLKQMSPLELRDLFDSAFSGFGYLPVCGGSLVAPGVVLTAAHCVANPSTSDPKTCNEIAGLFVARTGARFASSASDEEAAEYRIVTRAMCHPNYTIYAAPEGSDIQQQADILQDLGLLSAMDASGMVGLPVNDVAVLMLDAPFEDRPLVELASEEQYEAMENNDTAVQEMFIVGYGATRPGAATGSSVARWAAVSLWNEQECAMKTRESVDITPETYAGSQRVFDTLICAGGSNDLVDACQGDSGGPAYIQVADGGYRQAGIVSFGIGCANPDSPGFYSRVPSYREWVMEWAEEWTVELEELMQNGPLNMTVSVQGEDGADDDGYGYGYGASYGQYDDGSGQQSGEEGQADQYYYQDDDPYADIDEYAYDMLDNELYYDVLDSGEYQSDEGEQYYDDVSSSDSPAGSDDGPPDATREKSQ